MHLMRQADIGIPIFIKQVEDHTKLKRKLLKAISSMGTRSINDEFQSISNTDWTLGSASYRPYWEIAEPVFQDHLDRIAAEHYGPGFKVRWNNRWFQQYLKGDWHGWHLHPDTMYSNVYYLELPTGTAKTTFKVNGKEVEVEVSEGDIISFPNVLLHCSKPNPVDSRKTVIVVNSNFVEMKTS